MSVEIFEKPKTCCCGHSEMNHNMGYRGWMPALMTRSCMVNNCQCRDFHESPKQSSVQLAAVR